MYIDTVCWDISDRLISNLRELKYSTRVRACALQYVIYKHGIIAEDLVKATKYGLSHYLTHLMKVTNWKKEWGRYTWGRGDGQWSGDRDPLLVRGRCTSLPETECGYSPYDHEMADCCDRFDNPYRRTSTIVADITFCKPKLLRHIFTLKHNATKYDVPKHEVQPFIKHYEVILRLSGVKYEKENQ